MSLDAGTVAFLDAFNFTGGFPTSKDFAPAIIFTIVFVVALGALLFRVARPQDRTPVLIRPAIFIFVRLGTFILRAVMAKNTYGQSELIAELVLVSVGFLFLISPLISMWRTHVESDVPTDMQPGWVKRLARIAQLLLIVTIALAIAGSALISSASSGGTSTSTVETLRKASYILSLVLVAVVLAAIVLTHVRLGLGARGSLALVVPAVLLLVVAIYRVVQIYADDPSAPVRSLAAFWVLQITLEFLALCCFLAISIPTEFPGDARKAGTDASVAEQGLVMSRR